MARAIHSCGIPIVSAVGHEVDVTISDYVADRRAPTPTAAGEMVVPSESDLRLALDQSRRRLALALQTKLKTLRQSLGSLASAYVLRKPLDQIEQRAQRIDETWHRLVRDMTAMIETKKRAIESARKILEGLDPSRVLARGYSITMISGGDEPLTDTSALRKGMTIETVLSKGRIKSVVGECDGADSRS